MAGSRDTKSDTRGGPHELPALFDAKLLDVGSLTAAPTVVPDGCDLQVYNPSGSAVIIDVEGRNGSVLADFSVGAQQGFILPGETFSRVIADTTGLVFVTVPAKSPWVFPQTVGAGTSLSVQGTVNVGSTNGQSVPSVPQTKSGGGTTIASVSTGGILNGIVQAAGVALPSFNINGEGAQGYPPTFGPDMSATVASSLYYYRVPVQAGDSIVVAGGVWVGSVVVTAS